MLMSNRLDSAKARRAIETIERNARAQAQIVEDLLDISRIVSGKLRLNVQLCSPHGSVEAAVEALRPAAMAKSVSIQLTIDPLAGPISGDPERLQQIVWNLLSNAVKFTPKGGRVHLALQRHHANVHIIVSDNGAGISQEYIPRIFDSFTQVDSSLSRKHGGLGLGLSIVKKLAELHGGTVTVHSDGVGKGASFTVALPLAPLDSTHVPTPVTGEPSQLYRIPVNTEEFGLAGLIVLLVEDDEDARNMLASVLSSARAVVETAGNAEEALVLLESIHPNIIISDIGMPGMDGYEFIAKVRQQEKRSGQPSVPAVALTAYARIQDRMRALTSGFQMHVAKPVEPIELLTVLSTLRTWHVPSQ
jgi:CheY-like chemotaxis protein